jgi:hypothetical protein
VLILVVDVLTCVEVDVNGVITVKVEVVGEVEVEVEVEVVVMLVVCVVDTDMDVVVVVVACCTLRVILEDWGVGKPPAGVAQLGRTDAHTII